MEMQPYVITVDDSLAATMPTAAAVPEGGGEDGYRTVLEIIASCTQPCIGIYVAVNSLAPTAGGRCWHLQHGQTCDNLSVVFTYWNCICRIVSCSC